MSASKGYIHSIQFLGTVDGPGLRSVVFLTGCPLRCQCCHNPDTWNLQDGEEIEAQALTKKLLAYRPYWRGGGVTASGGEPLMQAAFLGDVFDRLKAQGVHTALDTSGCVWDEMVERLIDVTDLVLLDIKQTTETAYRDFCGGSLSQTMEFLSCLQERGKPVWIRHVVIPGMTDGEENLTRLGDLIAPFSCVKKVELLPFVRLCLEKYESMGIPFPLSQVPAADEEVMTRVHRCFGRYDPAERG